MIETLKHFKMYTLRNTIKKVTNDDVGMNKIKETNYLKITH